MPSPIEEGSLFILYTHQQKWFNSDLSSMVGFQISSSANRDKQASKFMDDIKSFSPRPNVRKAIWNLRQKYTNAGSATNSDFIPFIKNAIPSDARTVIDVGCGKLNDGNPEKEDILISLLNENKYKITGIDGFDKNIEWRKMRDPQGEYLLMNVLDIKNLKRKFDVVICHHVIEHVEKDLSMKLVRDLESITEKVLIIGTPIGFTDTSYAVKLHNNPLELHKCGWMPEEFENLGYSTTSKKNAFVALKFFN